MVVWSVKGQVVAGGLVQRFSTPKTDQRGYLTDQRAFASATGFCWALPLVGMSQMCEDLVSCEERSENLRDEAALLTGGGLIECYEWTATVVNGSRTAVHR